MKTIEKTPTRSTVELSTLELLILNNALNEICNGVDISAFETRLGASRAEVTELLREIGTCIDD